MITMIKDGHYYVSSSDIASKINGEAAAGRIIVPFRPPMSTAAAVREITPDFFYAKTLYGSFHKYPHKDIMEIQMKRIGYSGDADSFDEPVLTVYGMMMTGLVTAVNSGTQITRLYTLNPRLASYFCGNSAVKVIFSSTRETSIDLKKNAITCMEIIPKREQDRWSFDCQPAFFELKKNQMISYTLSLLGVRERLISYLFRNIVDIKYFDMKKQEIRNISTCLSQSVLSAIMDEKAYGQIIGGVIDEKRMATLKLPVLQSSPNELAEIFMPSISALSFKSTGLITGGKFDPFKGNA